MDFVNDTISQFPDFDDQKLTEEGINFPDPGGLDVAFRKDHPNDWSEISWEYPIIVLNWIEAAQTDGGIEGADVLAAMKSNKQEFVIWRW
ncbi:MAG: branched-chain amino acid transport system substrate-binding protein [Parasphingorhabdus sp.]